MIKNILKTSLFVLLVLNQAFCYSQINKLNEDELIIRFDEFKKENTALLKINSHSVETEKGFWREIPKHILNANIYKTEPSNSNITFSFSLIIRDIYEPLDSIAYLNINDSIYQLKVSNISKNLVTNIDAKTTGIGSEERVTGINTNNLIIYNGQICLTSDIYEKLEPKTKFVLRVYLDYETITFRFLPSETELLYQFTQAIMN